MTRTLGLVALCALLGCDHDATTPTADAATADPDAPELDAAPALQLGAVGDVRDLAACPQGAPAGSSCRQITVSGCPGIETETIDAVIAVRRQAGATLRGTVVHFSGGGGTTFQGGAGTGYGAAGLQTVHVAWLAPWEQTSVGLKAAGCRPATVLRWIFDEPTLHAGSRATAFCGEGFSGGSGQLGYALAHYGLGDYLDYVNELSGPPFGRIDLGCDGDAPATADVCGTATTTKLPGSLTAWENMQTPVSCGGTAVPATELARWRADSIAFGGTYSYPNTQVQFFACTNNATAVTAMGKLYFDEIAAATSGDAMRAQYHCFDAADNCQGENLGDGARMANQALIDNCLPRHQ